MARINFILPFFPTKPVGGAKIMFQFANKLQARGHSVAIYYSIRRPFKKQKTPVWFRLLMIRLRSKSVNWFPINESIKQNVVPEISDKYVRDADATMCTWWQMAYAVAKLGDSKGRKFNFIQDHELWTGQDDRVHDSYKLPVTHIVIAKYLQELVEKHSGTKPAHVNISIDMDYFRITVPPTDRPDASLIMMYSEEPRKGTAYGIQALEEVKKRIPEFAVTMFSVYQRPASLPGWITFHTRPSDLPGLLNQHSIFFAPSLGEGWALPPAEAMICGCAVVCTDIGGHRDYGIDGITALLVESKNVHDMSEKIIRLINDRVLRLRLSDAGNTLLRSEFTWDKALNHLEQLLVKKP